MEGQDTAKKQAMYQGGTFLCALGLACLLLSILVTASQANDPKNNLAPSAFESRDKPLKTIIVPDYYPYTFVNDLGRPDGFSVDLAKAVARVLDRTLDIGVGTWQQAQASLENGTVDFLPMMAASSQRGQLFDFSVPHTIAYDALFVRSNEPKIRSLEDLSGRTVIVMNKDAAHEFLLGLPIAGTIKLILVDSLPEGLRLLASGTGDTAIMPELVGLLLVKKLGIKNVEESPLTLQSYKRPFSFAVKKGNKALLEALGQGLSLVEANGQYRDIYDKWFGVVAPKGVSWKSILKYSAVILGVSALVLMGLLAWTLTLRKRVAQRTRSLVSEIASRKKAEEEARRANKEWERTFDAISDGIMILDCEHKIVRANRAMANALGKPESKLIGKSCFDLVHGAKEPPAFCPHSQLLSDGEPHVAEVTEPLLGATLEVRVSPVFDAEGLVRGSVHVTRDITARKKAETELQQSRDLLRAIIDAAPTPIFGLDLDGNIQTVWNPASEKMLGWTADEVMGRPLPSVPAESTEEFTVFREMIRKDETLNGVEVRRKRRDGSPIDYTIYASPLHDAEGRISGNIAVLVDVTERKRVEQSLQDSEARLRMTLEATQIGIWDWDVKNDQWHASPTYFTMLGYEPSTDLGDRREWLERVHPEDRALVQEKIQSLLKGNSSGYEYEARLRHANGMYRWQYVRGVSVNCDADGNILRVLGIRIDIDDRKRVEEELAGREREYRTLVENLSDFVVRYDTDLRRIYVNPAWEKSSGLSAAEVINVPATDIPRVSSPANLEYVEKLRQALETGTPQEIEFTWVNARGVPLCLSYVIVPEYGQDGKIASLLAVGHDITSRRQAEEALRKASAYNRSLIEASLDPLVTISSEGKITDVNTATERVTGYSRQELIGTDFADYFSDPHIARAGYQQAFKIGSVMDYALNIRHKDGKTIPVLYNASVYRDHSGEILGLFAAARDITELRNAEKKTAEKIRFQRLLMDAIPNPIFFKDKEGKFLGCNEAFSNFLGRTEAEIVGRSVYEVYNDHRAELYHAKDTELLATGGLQTYEEKVRSANGSEHDVIFYKSTFPDLEGTVGGLIGVVLDITEQKRTQQRLSESEEQYRAVFQNAGVGIKVVRKDKRIAQVNPSLSRMLGYSETELLELTPLDLTYPDDREATNEYLDAILGDDLDTLRLERRYLKKDGGTVWGDVSVSVMRDPQGNRAAALEVIADITEGKKAQVALQESEARMRRIIDSSPIGIRITQHGKLVYANRALADMFGYDNQDQILSLPVEAFFAPETQPLVRRRVAEWMDGGTIPAHYEASGLTRSGKTIAIESWGTEINYLGEKSWLAFVIDVSESKSLRAQLLQAQKMEAMGTLAGGIAHDFNNLLTVTLGYAEILLQDKQREDPDYEDLQKILHASQRGADLVRSLLIFSRKSDAKPRPLNLNHEVEKIKSLLDRMIPKMIEIRLDLCEKLRVVTADPGQIEQVLMNLAVNARDAMPNGGVLTIRTENATRDDAYGNSQLQGEAENYAILIVTDNGHGMDKETQDRIFEPFFTTKEAGKGTGLGLATVYGIVKQHGGAITCESEPSEGTTFRIYLPVGEMDSDGDAAAPVAQALLGTETILLVDDEDSVKDLGKKILAQSGYTVITAANGKEALEIYQERREEVSLIVLDWIMPEMGGKQFLEEICDIDPKARILVVSGLQSGGTAAITREHGARGFIGKPYNAREFLKSVREILDEDSQELLFGPTHENQLWCTVVVTTSLALSPLIPGHPLWGTSGLCRCPRGLSL